MTKRNLINAQRDRTFFAALQDIRNQADELLALYDAMVHLEVKYRAKGRPVPPVLRHLRHAFERDFGPGHHSDPGELQFSTDLRNVRPG